MIRLILIFLCIPFAGYPQTFVWTENCLEAYSQAARLNFNHVYQLCQEEQKQHPSNLLIHYAESQADFIKCFISENKTDLDQLKSKNDKRIKMLEDSKVKSPYTKMLMAEYLIQTAVARLKFEEHLSAVYETRKAFKLLEENVKIYPDFKPNRKGLGFIHTVVGAAPRNYQWMLNLLGFSGTTQSGLNELRELLSYAVKHKEYGWMKDELIILITFMEMNLVKEKSDDDIRKRLNSITNIENKPLMQFAKCVYHFANSENDSIIHILSTRKLPDEQYRLYYLDYMEGLARLNKLDHTAEVCFKKYVGGFRGMTFIKSAYQRLAWSRLIQNDEAGYYQYIKLAGDKGSGTTFSDEDKQALKESKDKEKPNVILLRSRLLFDGGYYQRSVAEIAGKPVSDFPLLRDKLEFTYRLARIFDKTDRKEKAIIYYQQTIENGKNFKYYFAANSALLLALLYEEAGNKIKAAEYFKLCLDMRDHEYQNSIDQKAKAGLGRVTTK